MMVPYDPAIGPIVRIEIAFPVSLHQPGAAATAPAGVNVLIDTGARRTHIARPVLNALGLPIVAKRPLISSTGTSTVDVFVGDIAIPGSGASFSSMEVPELPNASERFQDVLGRDILDQGTLTVDGPGRTIILEF